MFIALTFTLMSCGDDDYTVDAAYEKAEITNVTLYGRNEAVMSDKTQIDSEAGAITVSLKADADITDLKMVATISAGATLTPGMAVGFQDYSSPRTYTVTSPGGTVVKQWTITVAPATN
ncbi:DUF5018 domain-containing protein [Bacteroides fluxus]|nr:DUF5018 domain-containing protein [Bacteroides fluxus]